MSFAKFSEVQKVDGTDKHTDIITCSLTLLPTEFLTVQWHGVYSYSYAIITTICTPLEEPAFISLQTTEGDEWLPETNKTQRLKQKDCQ